MGEGTKAKAERNQKMLELRKKGWTLQKLAEKYKISRERVRQKTTIKTREAGEKK